MRQHMGPHEVYDVGISMIWAAFNRILFRQWFDKKGNSFFLQKFIRFSALERSVNRTSLTTLFRVIVIGGADIGNTRIRESFTISVA